MSRPDPPTISKEQISGVLSGFGVEPSSDQLGQIHDYIYKLLKWNSTVSLTTVMDPVEIVSRHFGESMFAATVLPLEKRRLVDVGSGAGFPGLALKILCPALLLTLIESNKKKSAFLADMVRTLNLTGVEVLPIRFEEMGADARAFDIVTARALGGFPELLRWAKRILAERGHVVLWVGGDDIARITNLGGWIWNPAVRIPESQRRFILTGRPSP